MVEEPEKQVVPGESELCRRRLLWPMVMGLAVLVLGAWGAYQGVGVVVETRSFRAEMARVFLDQPPQEVEAMRVWSGFLLAVTIAELAMALLLLMVGVQLIRCHPMVISLGRLWAVVKMLLVVGALVVENTVQEIQPGGMDSLFKMPASATETVKTVWMFYLVIRGWTLPILLLIWFWRPSIKKEVARWS